MTRQEAEAIVRASPIIKGVDNAAGTVGSPTGLLVYATDPDDLVNYENQLIAQRMALGLGGSVDVGGGVTCYYRVMHESRTMSGTLFVTA